MPDVVVAGSINMDVVASAWRHPRPGETVTGAELGHFPGGKGANQAVAAAQAGATVRMLGAVGKDTSGTDARQFLDDAGVDTRSVETRDDLTTGTALVVVAANGENMIVVIPGANATVDEEAVTASGAKEDDVLVTQYEIPRQSAVAFLRHGRAIGATCLLNPAPAAPTPPQLLELVDVLVLNETELAVIAGVDITSKSSETEIVNAFGKLQANGLTGVAVATLGSRGVLAVTPDGALRIDAHQVQVTDTTGAGDCFVGALAAELAGGIPLSPALEFANAAAAACVTRPGAGPSMPARIEVEAFRHASR